jgi:membrane-associated phospholipid phosphatase
MRITSQFLSWLFHPLTMVSYAALVYFFILPSPFAFNPLLAWFVTGMLIIGTVLLPSATALLMLRVGKISNLQMSERQERNWPLVQAIVIYAACLAALYIRQVPAFVQLFLLGSVLAMIAGLLINLNSKISLHMIGAGGLCGGLSGLMLSGESGTNLSLLAGVFILTGVLGSARLYLESHSPVQILSGFIVGFGAEFLLMLFGL